MPSTALRFACNVCGRARVPLDDASVTRSFGEVPDLERANRARAARGVWAVAAAAATGFGAFSLLVLALVVAVAHPGALATAFTGVAAAVPFLFAVMAALRARTNTRVLEESLDEAWLKVAAEYAKAHGTIDAKALAAAMRVGEPTADLLLAKLSVGDLLSGAVAGDGRLAYGAREAPRLRVDAGAPPAAADPSTLPATSDELAEATAAATDGASGGGKGSAGA